MPNNSITSSLTISTAVSVLGDMLSNIGNYTLNVASEATGRASTINVPIVKTDDGARDWDASKGYTVDADSDVSTLAVSCVEVLKPFVLNDSEYNSSPLTLQSYIKQNAHEFGRYLNNKIFTAVDGVTGGTSKNASSVAVGDIKNLASSLDAKGAPLDRHCVISASAHSAILPSTAETYGQGVIERGRFTSLYGMSMTPATAFNTGTGKTNTFACSSDAIVIVNRIPEIQATSNLEEYTPFEVEGLGLQCAFRRFYDPTSGSHYGAFVTNWGVGVAKPDHIAKIKNSS